MSELTSNQYLIIIAVLVFISIVMLFLLSRSKRDTQELQQDLNKTIDDYNQLAERFDSLSVVKNQLEQQAVKAQTHAEGLQTRLNERDEKIQYLEKELDEEQLRHDQIGGQITALKERFGIASAQAESLQGQLQQAQENVLRKEQEQQKTQEKLTALSSWDLHSTHEAIEQTAAELEVGMGKVGMPLRVAVTGSGQSPSMDVTLVGIGRERVLARIQRAIDFIKSQNA